MTRAFRLALAAWFTLLCVNLPSDALTPGQEIVLFGNITPVYQCNYTLGALCGGEVYLTTSLHTVTDKTGTTTYASNNLLLNSATLSTQSVTLSAKSNLLSFYGTGSVTASWASGFSSPQSPAFDTSGNLYVANYNNNTVSKVTSGGSVTASWASGFSSPQGLAFDTSGNLYVANFSNNTVSKVTSGGSVTASWASGFSSPQGLAFDTSGNLYVGNTTNNTVSKVLIGLGIGTQVYSNFYPAAGSTSFTVSGSVTSATLSAVTYETLPRFGQNGPNDSRITTSAAYYGAPFTNTLGTGAPAQGLQYEPVGMNLYINSGSPATQTITVTNATTYTSSIRQTGTQTFSGAISAILTGSANTVVSNTNAAITTSLVATDAGLAATSYPQVEVGTFPTSVIISGATATTRAADSLTTTGKLASANASGPSIIEYAPESTGTPTRAIVAKGGSLFTTGRIYRRVCVYPLGTPNAYLNTKLAVGGSC